MPEEAVETTGTGEAPPAAAPGAAPNVGDGGSPQPTNSPPRRNQDGEAARLRRQLRESKRENDSRSQRLREALDGEGSQVTPQQSASLDVDSLPDPYDVSKEEFWGEVQNLISKGATERASELIGSERKRSTQEATEARRLQLTNDNVDRFKSDRRWTGDGETWQKYVKHMNTIWGQGENGEITAEQLEAGEWAVRGPEMAGEAASNVQGRTIRQMSNNAGARSPSNRGSSTSFEDMSIDDQVSDLGDSSLSDDQRVSLFRKLPDDRKRQILMRIDPEVQPSRQF